MQGTLSNPYLGAMRVPGFPAYLPHVRKTRTRNSIKTAVSSVVVVHCFFHITQYERNVTVIKRLKCRKIICENRALIGYYTRIINAVTIVTIPRLRFMLNA